MKNFAQIPAANIQRSSLNRSHNLKTTLNPDLLVPIFCDEVLPGDTFNVRLQTFGRLSTPITALMDNLSLDTFFFFQPARLCWSNFQKFMGERLSPADSTDYILPVATSPAPNGYLTNTLQDYMGLPTKIASVTHQNLPMRAYNQIWNEWFRDQNLQVPVVKNLGDGPDNVADYVLKKRAKIHDYFTSALLSPQKGPAVTLPMGTSAPVLRTSNANMWSVFDDGTNDNSADEFLAISGGELNNDLASQSYSLDPNGGLYADLTLATSVTVNQLIESMRLQEFYVKDARGGTRYIESNLSHFGVVSADARLIRPEYLGGGSTAINIHPIAQTSVTAATPQGNLASFGTLSGSSGFVKSFTEHGFIIGLANIKADLTYQQGIHRMWTRSTRLDHYFPSFAHLGEQAILNKEIMCQGTSADNNVFGYIPRHDEYRFSQNRLTGQMRSNATSTFHIWHLAASFSSLPVLNSAFIESTTPIARILAVPSEPAILLDCYFNIISVRPMPMYSIPGSKGSF